MKCIMVLVLFITFSIQTKIISLNPGQTYNFTVRSPKKSSIMLHEIHRDTTRLQCSRHKDKNTYPFMYTCKLKIADDFYESNNHATSSFAVLSKNNQALKPIFYIKINGEPS